MRIEEPGNIVRTTTKGKRKPRKIGAGAAFTPDVAESALPSAQATASSDPVASLDAVLALQEVGHDDTSRSNREAIVHGEGLLRQLSKLRDAMLGEGIKSDTLDQLQDLLRSPKPVVDPELKRIIEDIRLRAEVEIAKHNPARRLDRTT